MRRDPAVGDEHLEIDPAWQQPPDRTWFRGLGALLVAQPESACLQRGRNALIRLVVGDRAVVVKQFGTPSNPWRRMLARWSSSKAVRSFRAAQALVVHGVGTPAPLALYERRQQGRLLESYYLCADAGPVPTLRAIVTAPDGTVLPLAFAFGAWAGRLHAAGIRHRDFTAGNILLLPAERFALVDLNRVAFGPVAPLTGLYDLIQPGFSGAVLDAVLEGYLAARSSDAAVDDRAAAHGLTALNRWRWAIKNATRPWRRRIGW